MTEKNLKAFGLQLQRLRLAAGLYQDQLVDRLSVIHARYDPKTDLRLDGNRISKWERAFKNRQGREWRPKRRHVLYLIEFFSEWLTLEGAYEWALQAGYRLDHDELQGCFLAGQETARAGAYSPTRRINLERLELAPNQALFGIDRYQTQLHFTLQRREAPWLMAIDGIGGIGKTSLANSVAHDIMLTSRFYDLAWVSAKQEEFLIGSGLQQTKQPVLGPETLTDRLLEQLDDNVSLTQSAAEKLAIITRLLKQASYLIVIDNLETAIDYQVLLPLLGKLANPSKILLTSRHSLHDYPDVSCLNLKGLSKSDTFTLLRHEAEARDLPALVDHGSEAILEAIYKVVGGNPLALKLVVGQLRVLPLEAVLEGLKQAKGKKIEELYTYIYWQAWHALTPLSQAVLLVMPLAQGGSFAQLTTVSELAPDELQQGLEQLINLSLVEVRGDIEQRRYHIHRLTETFLLTEVAKWQ